MVYRLNTPETGEPETRLTRCYRPPTSSRPSRPPSVPLPAFRFALDLLFFLPAPPLPSPSTSLAADPTSSPRAPLLRWSDRSGAFQARQCVPLVAANTTLGQETKPLLLCVRS